jgi:hypothetical protein
VGVDIAQQLHVARALNFRRIIVGDPLTFESTWEFQKIGLDNETMKIIYVGKALDFIIYSHFLSMGILHIDIKAVQ